MKAVRMQDFFTKIRGMWNGEEMCRRISALSFHPEAKPQVSASGLIPPGSLRHSISQRNFLQTKNLPSTPEGSLKKC